MEFFNGFLTWNCIIAVSIGFFIGLLVFRRKNSVNEELITLRADKNDNSKIENAFEKYKTSEEFKAILEKEYLKGRGEGSEAELKNFTIQLMPFARKTGGLVNYVGENGYKMQMFYRGLPIGDPTERILEREQKVKTDEVWKLIGAATKVIERIAEIGSKNKIPFQVLEGKEE